MGLGDYLSLCSLIVSMIVACILVWRVLMDVKSKERTAKLQSDLNKLEDKLSFERQMRVRKKVFRFEYEYIELDELEKSARKTFTVLGGFISSSTPQYDGPAYPMGEIIAVSRDFTTNIQAIILNDDDSSELVAACNDINDVLTKISAAMIKQKEILGGDPNAEWIPEIKQLRDEYKREQIAFLSMIRAEKKKLINYKETLED